MTPQEIYKQRIEEVARKYMNEALEMNNVVGDNLHYEDLKTCFIDAANFILQHQWISVEEALPEEDIPNCFVAYKTLDMVFYSTGSYEKDNDEWYVDSVGFNVKVTHWMLIPSLEGGEE